MALIVECFGPPGAGKTTFAKALAARLRAQGVEAEPRLSARPGERESDAASAGALGRLTRPLLVLTVQALGARRAPALALAATAGGVFARMRLRQYLFRLAEDWRRAQTQPGVVIFDQAYLQFVATIHAAKEPGLWDGVAAALDAVPACDLALRLDATPKLLETRLSERLARIGRFGRLLEAGAASGASYDAVCAIIQRQLEADERATLATRSGEGLSEEVDRIARVILASFGRRLDGAKAETVP